MIIFHAYLFHHGDRSQLDGYELKKSIRFFAYLQDNNFVLPAAPETYHAMADGWCHGCKQCAEVKANLKDHRCNGEEGMVWRCKYDRQKIIHMDSGMQVMGDI